MPLARNKHFESGQAILLIVFSIIGVIGFVALAVDGGRTLLERRAVQNAVDSAALGAALARVRDPQGEWAEKGYAIARQNGYEGDGKNNGVVIYSPPISGKYAGDIEYIQVIIFSRVPMYFGGVIGIRSSTVVAEAISRTKTPELKEMLNGDAIVSLRPTSECGDNPHDAAFWIHGESTFNVTGGGIFVNSNNPDCALQQNGNGSIRLQDEDAQIKIVGGADIQKPQLLTPFPPITGASPISYPPPFFMPKIGCQQNAQVSPDGLSISPGNWEFETFPPEGVTNLEPGVYCLSNADFKPRPNSELKGDDVVFLIEGGQVKISKEANVSLSAPSGGDFAGLLFYLPLGSQKPVVINASAFSSFRGTILAPSSEIHLNGSESNFGFHSQIIGYSILSNGQDDIKIKYTDEENYDAYTMPEVYLIK